MLTVVSSEDALASAAAERVTACLEATLATRGHALMSLTGGRTPRHLYSRLADPLFPWRARIDWTRLHVFWGDERHVPPDHPDSNFGMAHTALLQRVPVPDSQVHRMRGELDARDAAQEYEQVLRDGFAAAGRPDLTFDVVLLGLGEDAHIASVFPGSELLEWRPVKGRPADGAETVGRGFTPRRAAAVWAPHLHAWRITLTPAALLDAAAIVMLVAGTTKADAVYAALDAPLDVPRYPAQLLREAGDRVEWFVDRPASRRLRLDPARSTTRRSAR